MRMEMLGVLTGKKGSNYLKVLETVFNNQQDTQERIHYLEYKQNPNYDG